MLQPNEEDMGDQYIKAAFMDPGYVLPPAPAETSLD